MRRVMLDMDGVFADFDKGYLDRFGHNCFNVEDAAMWANIDTVKDIFFSELPVMAGAVEFYWALWANGIDPIFLTACPESNFESVARQKKWWIKEHVSPNALVIPVVHGRNKHHYLQTQGDILIDDFSRNIERWNKAGGYGILHDAEVSNFDDHFLLVTGLV